MNELYILGGGAFAIKVYACAVARGMLVRAFVVQNAGASSPIPSVRIIDDEQIEKAVVDCGLFIAIGNGAKRAELMEYYKLKGWIFPVLAHPRATLAPGVHVEEGVYIAPGCVIEANSTIGRGSIIDIGVLLDHEVIVKPFSHLRSPSCIPPRSIVSEYD